MPLDGIPDDGVPTDSDPIVDNSTPGATAPTGMSTPSSNGTTANSSAADTSSSDNSPDDSPDSHSKLNGPVLPLDLTQLVAAHHGAVYRYGYRMCGNASEAEDIAQQTFLIAHQKLDQLRDHEKALGWLLAVARSCFLKNRRKRLPLSAGDVDYDVEAIPEPTVDETAVDSQRLQTALGRMALEPRLVLTLFYFEDCSYKEIADKLSIPIGTVMSRLSRAKDKLKRELQQLEEEAQKQRQKAQENSLANKRSH